MSRWPVFVGAGLILVVALAAYHNCFDRPFIFDDDGSITDNPTIRELWPITGALRPPGGGETVTGRPLVNLSLAVNYALGGLNVWGYHAVNLAIHVAAAFLLFGIVRRTLLLPGIPEHYRSAATALGLAVGLLWVVHPLQTIAVTYVVQRAESMVSLFYLLTLYCVVRGATGHHATAWYSAAVIACLLGMTSKEVMVTAPVVVLLYDRTFLVGSFRSALRQRWALYLALAATWAALIGLVISAGGRGGSAGFGSGVSPSSYAATQFGAICGYLRLCFWPDRLIFDYGTATAQATGEIVPYAVVVTALLVATGFTLLKWPRLGFLGAALFIILSPTSTFVPVATQTIGEHRMYLPLACVLALSVLGVYELVIGRLGADCGTRHMAVRGAAALGILLVVTLVLAGCTIRRNQDYGALLTIWQDTVTKRPQNERAHSNLSVALLDLGRFEEAVAHCQKALQINTGYYEAHNNWGLALEKQGRVPEAVAHYQEALRLNPDFAEAHCNWGSALQGVGRFEEAVAHYQEALRIKPDYAEPHYNWGHVLQGLGRYQEALAHYQDALRIKPDYAEAHNNLGVTLQGLGRSDESIAHFQAATRIRQDYAGAHTNLGLALEKTGRIEEAVAHYQEALRIKPDNAEVHNNCGILVVKQGRLEEAIRHFQQAVRLNPDLTDAQNNLRRAEALLPQKHGPAQR